MTDQPSGPTVREGQEHPAPYTYGEPAPQPVPNSPLALASLASAIAAWFIIPAIGAVAAIVLGVLAHDQIRKARGRLKGSDLATAAIVVGGVQIGFILFAVAGVLLAVPAG